MAVRYLGYNPVSWGDEIRKIEPVTPSVTPTQTQATQGSAGTQRSEDMLYKITKAFTFDAAHRLPHYDGACANMHGHTWRVEVTIAANEVATHGSKVGMVMDFKNMKALVGPLVADLDHNVLNEVDGLSNPTAESIAAWFFATIENRLRNHSTVSPKVSLHAVKVWESPDSCCEVTR